MEILKKTEKFIYGTALWKLILLVAVLTLVKTGVWFIPSLGATRMIALNPFVNPFPDASWHHLFWSWLGPFMAWLIGANTPNAFIFFHLGFSLAASALFIKIVFSRFSDKTARTSLLLFTVLPVSAISYYWAGSDSIVLFLMLLAFAWPQHAALTLCAGIALGMQHFEQSFFAVGGLLFALLLGKKLDTKVGYSIRFCVWLLLGVVAGKFALIGIFNYFAIEVNSGRAHWLKENLPGMLNQFKYHTQSIIWSFLGIGWLVALRYADWGRKALPFLLTLFGLCLLLPVSGDQTRVLAVVTFPLVLTFWLLNSDFLERIDGKEVALVFWVWAMMPWVWVWGGNPKWSVISWDITLVLNWLFGWYSVPAEIALWPFI